MIATAAVATDDAATFAAAELKATASTMAVAESIVTNQLNRH